MKKINIITSVVILATGISCAFAALNGTTVNVIRGDAPYLTHIDTGDVNVPAHVYFFRMLTDGTTVDISTLPPPENKVQVYDTLAVRFRIYDNNGDQPPNSYFGIQGKKSPDNEDIDTYFILTNPAGVTSTVGPNGYSLPDISTVKPYYTAMMQYSIGPDLLGYKYVGFNLAAVTSYGLPYNGTIYSGQNAYNIPGIPSTVPDPEDPWPIQPNPQITVGIFKASDMPADVNGGPAGITPLSAASSTETLKLGERYIAFIWRDRNGNGLYDTGESIYQDYMGSARLKYTWSVYDGNAAAGGSVATGSKIILEQNTSTKIITLPQTNAEVFTKWPSASGNGLPTTEAGIQGFKLQVDVDW
ncbi:hypothetical protein [Zophobihabitans entericus]|uniref:Uncharacterized protein n=1 Tax=Zophobihabitans entericus TaxID=1635327 RepID=A0A6G9I7Y0_9GAMM|nr:hypothetical protein [Zophobihabitans entericus]QIQ20315.1 hypothetical protein IPMB12_00650 [Zophobihabitans entericus]